MNKICFFNSTKAWGGGEKWHFEMANALWHQKKNVLVCTNVKSSLATRIQNTQIPFYEVKIGNLSFLNPLKIFRLSRFFKKQQITTIILNLPSDLKAAGRAARLAGVRQIIYRRGSAIPIKGSFFNRFLFRQVVTGIIANSYETKRTILQNNTDFIDEQKIKVIYNGIDLQTYDALETTSVYNRKKDELILGNAGRLDVQKAQYLLIEMVEKLKKEQINVKLLIAGKGKLEEELKIQVGQKGLEQEVVFLGFVENIKSFMTSIDVFVLTSQWEGFGYVLTEAMAVKKPVIAFDISSNPEIITNNKEGYLVKNKNINQLVEKVKELQSSALRTCFGNNARIKVEENFTFDRSVKELLEFLNDL